MDPEEKREPDWDSFETYKGPEEKERLPAWCYRVFDAFMVLLIGAIIFAVCGALVFLSSTRSSTKRAFAETPRTAWTKFCVGGCLGLGWAARHYFGKKEPPAI